jgi:hypothetical protein
MTFWRLLSYIPTMAMMIFLAYFLAVFSKIDGERDGSWQVSSLCVQL